MIIIHTADWHIGQNFFGYDRKNEHIFFLNWLKKTIKDVGADVLLVAGDVFDSPNPSAESQKVYYRFLREATSENPSLQIVITAGNHDSAARLEAPNPLLAEMNIQVRGVVRKNADDSFNCRQLFVPLIKNGKTEAWCIAVPYLRQGDYPNAETYTTGIEQMYELLYSEIQHVKQPGQAIMLMGHLQAKGGEVSKDDRSERTIIGGLECVSSDVFDKKDVLYTALGHLHKHQRIGGKENVRYSGSPLPMSFAEINYKQGVNLIEIENNALVRIGRIDFEPPVKLISLPKEPKSLPEVLESIVLLPDGDVTESSPYIELKVLLTEPEPSMQNQIEEALKNKSVRLTRAVPYRVNHQKENKTISYEELKTVNPLDMAEDVYAHRYGNEMPEKIKRLLVAAIEEINR